MAAAVHRLDVMRRNTTTLGPSRPAPTYSPLAVLLATVVVLVAVPALLAAITNPVASVGVAVLAVVASRLVRSVRRRRSGRGRSVRRYCLPATDRCLEV